MYVLMQSVPSQIMRQMIHSESVLQLRAMGLAPVQKFDSVLACGKKHVVLKEPALLFREQSDEQGRRWCHMKEHLQSLRELALVERSGEGSTLYRAANFARWIQAAVGL
jgi:hypothetical protein